MNETSTERLTVCEIVAEAVADEKPGWYVVGLPTNGRPAYLADFRPDGRSATRFAKRLSSDTQNGYPVLVTEVQTVVYAGEGHILGGVPHAVPKWTGAPGQVRS